jgi:protein-tyrosine phosphatase
MNATEIVPGLWMGGEILPIEYAGFGVILNLRELESLALGIQALLWLPLEDIPVPVPGWKISAASHLIAEVLVGTSLSSKVLVHCTAGHNRSGLIVGAYLILYLGYKADDAIALIRQKRPGALTNEVFVEQLRLL